jgi:hypothetical protein
VHLTEAAQGAMALATHELPRRFSPGLAEQQDIGFSQKSFHPDL